MTTTTKSLTLIDCLDYLHENPGPMLQRLVVEGPASSSDDYARLYSGKWELLGSWNPGRGTDIPTFIQANSWDGCRIRFSPNLCLVANASEMGPADVVCVRIPLPLSPPERIPSPAVGDSPTGFTSYDDLATLRGAVGLHALEQARANNAQVYSSASADAVLDRLRVLDPQPSLVINEGDSLAAMWRLSAKVTETTSPGYGLNAEGMPVPTLRNMSRFGLVHHRLALKLGGDVNAAARPFALLVDAPGTRRTDIKIGARPCPIVTAEIWNDNTYTLENLEALATRG
jgi:hypothetical protein